MRSKEYDIIIEKIVYNNDPQADFKGRKAIILVDIGQFNLTELQEARFKVLVGSRYKE